MLLLPVMGTGIASSSSLIRLAGVFMKAGAFSFGSGLAIVPFLHQGVVLDYQWLNERQFLDAVAVGIITTGPVVIMAAFVGYLVRCCLAQWSPQQRCFFRYISSSFLLAATLSATATVHRCVCLCAAQARPHRARLQAQLLCLERVPLSISKPR